MEEPEDVHNDEIEFTEPEWTPSNQIIPKYIKHKEYGPHLNMMEDNMNIKSIEGFMSTDLSKPLLEDFGKDNLARTGFTKKDAEYSFSMK